MSKTVWIVHQEASTPETGYAGRHYYLGKELAKLGFNVYLIASAAHHLLRHKPGLTSDFQFENHEDLNVVWVKMPLYSDAHSKVRAYSWFLFPWKIRKLSKIIPDAPDVILSSSPSLIAFLGSEWLAKKFNSRLVFDVRDLWPLTLTEIGRLSSNHPFIKFMQWVEDRAYRRSDHVISNLKNSVQHMVGRGLEPDKFSWIPNGFSQGEVDLNAPLNTEARRKLPQDKFVVGYTGTIGVANALDVLVDAAEILQRYSEIVFVLVGDGKEKLQIKRIVNEKRLKNVYFIDAIPKVEIQAILKTFDVTYIGLKKDALFRFGVSPNKLFDYLYAGKPIVYGINSGNYQPVTESRAGIQVPAEDPERLAEAILKLYQMLGAERDALGANGRKAALEQYEYGKLARQLAPILFPD